MNRYIEAEEVEKRIDIVLGSEPKAWDKKALKELKMYIVHAVPSADVRENVRGRWVEVVDRTEMYDKEGVKTWGMLFQCNQCGFVLNAIEGHTGQYNYCPNCGADMRPISALSENAEIVSNLKRGES